MDFDNLPILSKDKSNFVHDFTLKLMLRSYGVVHPIQRLTNGFQQKNMSLVSLLINLAPCTELRKNLSAYIAAAVRAAVDYHIVCQ